MYCDSCNVQITKAHIYIHKEKPWFLCEKCYAAWVLPDDDIASASTSVHSLSANRSIVPVTTSTESKTIVHSTVSKSRQSCQMCYKDISDQKQVQRNKKILCETCSNFLDNLTWHTENPIQGIKIGNIDVDVLRQYCTADEDWFTELPGAQVQITPNGSRYIFFDNDSDILAVGHLDKSSGSLDREYFMCYEGQETARHFVFNGNLDDRLGVFVIHHLLPKVYGLKYDILLTTDEERGGSTADDFQKDWLKKEKRKQYNWGFEFDRHDMLPVLYMYSGGEWQKAIEEFTEVERGSVSDISYLDEMGCSFVNWGTAYYHEHTAKHFAVLEELEECVNKFLAFHEKYKDKHFVHLYVPQSSHSSSYGESWSWWRDDYMPAKQVFCDDCGKSCYHRHQGSDKLLRCFACHSKSKKGEAVLHCDECQETVPYLIKNPNKSEVCYDCYVSGYRINVKSCSSCQKTTAFPYEGHGMTYCKNCYEEIYGDG